MGYFRDEHWIIEGKSEALEALRDEIIDLIAKAFTDEEADYSNYVSPVLNGLANGYSCLFIPADGSKEGWTASDCMDKAREQILKKVIHNNAKSKTGKIVILQVIVDEYKDKPEVKWITKQH